MKNLKSLCILICFVCISLTTAQSKNELAKIIEVYETQRDYKFNPFESVEKTNEYYKLEADFATEMIQKINKISLDNLSESDKISRELLLFVLQDKIDEVKFKMHLNPITNEVAFHLNLGSMGSKVLKTKEDVAKYLKDLEKLNKSRSCSRNFSTQSSF